jgi:hypothetical protein
MAPDLADVRYWECVRIGLHDDGSSTYWLRVVKDRSGKNIGVEVGVLGRGDVLQLGELYDEFFNRVPRTSPPTCAYPMCDEPGIHLVRDGAGAILRACWDHAEEYRIEAHEATRHEGDMFDPNCDACWDEVRAGERPRPRRYRTWGPQ